MALLIPFLFFGQDIQLEVDLPDRLLKEDLVNGWERAQPQQSKQVISARDRNGLPHSYARLEGVFARLGDMHTHVNRTLPVHRDDDLVGQNQVLDLASIVSR